MLAEPDADADTDGDPPDPDEDPDEDAVPRPDPDPDPDQEPDPAQSPGGGLQPPVSSFPRSARSVDSSGGPAPDRWLARGPTVLTHRPPIGQFV